MHMSVHNMHENTQLFAQKKICINRYINMHKKQNNMHMNTIIYAQIIKGMIGIRKQYNYAHITTHYALKMRTIAYKNQVSTVMDETQKMIMIEHQTPLLFDSHKIAMDEHKR